ncbi:MAG TPA: superoxide dismutase family protein [Actinomycetota bacterium]|nr:superoxide dismutase family protein [Actinomycetota bacterium]
MTGTPRIRIVSALSLVVLVAVVAIATTQTGGMAPTACREQKKAKAVLRNVDGDRIGVVHFWNDASCVTRVVATIGSFSLEGENTGLTEGFHGFHIHSRGECDRAAVDDEGDASPFFTAGSHWNPDERNHGNHRGDLPPLLATNGGLARANVLTDRFQINRLFDDDGSAVIVHQDADNLAHIPATDSEGNERYHSHAADAMGPDPATLATGDGGSRFACGIVTRIRK